MAIGTIADDIEPRHKQASTPRFPQPGVLVGPSGPASVHATSSNRQVAAKPAQIQMRRLADGDQAGSEVIGLEDYPSGAS
jgi:hypothetical protein